MEAVLLGQTFSAEITGVDLSRNLSAAEAEEIKRIWLEHKVAVFRNQDIDDDALVAFTKLFGPLFIHFRSQFNDRTRPEIMLISNIKEDGRNLGELGDGDLMWHTDQAYSEQPVFSTLLYGIEVPAEGGGTWFCDTAGAYAALPDATKHRIAGLRQNFSVEKTVTTQNLALSDEQRLQKPPVQHPLVRTHPLLGRKSLYLSPAHTKGIEGMDHHDSTSLLNELLEWATRPEFVYRHEWRVGDLVMCDNTSTMHSRDAFSPSERRLLKRTGFEFSPDRAVPV